MWVRWVVVFPILWAAAIGIVSCGDDSSPEAPQFGELVVWVHWNDQGLEGERIDILETGESKTTDADGLVRFRIASGTYTLRAYVNTGGPPLPTDLRVTVRPAQETRIEIADCLPCVASS
jgi:hypothetical protein